MGNSTLKTMLKYMITMEGMGFEPVSCIQGFILYRLGDDLYLILKAEWGSKPYHKKGESNFIGKWSQVNKQKNWIEFG